MSDLALFRRRLLKNPRQVSAIAQHLYAHYPEFNAVRENIRG